MAVVLLSSALLMFVVQKFVLEAKEHVTLSGQKTARARMLITDNSVRIRSLSFSAGSTLCHWRNLCVPYGFVCSFMGL